ncbi:MAG: thioredoxin domain-containing protein [bacterium]|nr:thioredoxin domain-containing protein [bacterium]
MQPWYLRWWGIAILAYIAVTAVLGIVFLVSSRGALGQSPSPLDAFRTGGFTTKEGAGGTFDASVPIVTDRDPALGADHPALTIVEFSDFQCPFCRQSFPIIREAVTQYGDRLRFVYRDYPVDELHADARAAAEAAQCAHAQGKFWAYHDKLFQNADALDAASLTRYAAQVGLDQTAFAACVAARTFAAAVEEDYQAGVKLGVAGTPTWFFLSDGDPKKARRVEGVIPRDALLKFLERTLR